MLRLGSQESGGFSRLTNHLTFLTSASCPDPKNPKNRRRIWKRLALRSQNHRSTLKRHTRKRYANMAAEGHVGKRYANMGVEDHVGERSGTTSAT